MAHVKITSVTKHNSYECMLQDAGVTGDDGNQTLFVIVFHPDIGFYRLHLAQDGKWYGPGDHMRDEPFELIQPPMTPEAATRG
jgi:hypothetical protein